MDPNVIAMLAELGVWYWTGVLSLIEDGLDSVIDTTSNIISLVGIQLCERHSHKGKCYGRANTGIDSIGWRNT